MEGLLARRADLLMEGLKRSRLNNHQHRLASEDCRHIRRGSGQRSPTVAAVSPALEGRISAVRREEARRWLQPCHDSPKRDERAVQRQFGRKTKACLLWLPHHPSRNRWPDQHYNNVNEQQLRRERRESSNHDGNIPACDDGIAQLHLQVSMAVGVCAVSI